MKYLILVLINIMVISSSLTGQIGSNNICDTLNILRVRSNDENIIELEFYNETSQELALFTGKLGYCVFNNFLTFQIDTLSQTVNVNLLPNYINHKWFYPYCDEESDKVESVRAWERKKFIIKKNEAFLDYYVSDNCILLTTENTLNEIHVKKQPSSRSLGEFEDYNVVFWYSITFSLNHQIVENKVDDYLSYNDWLNNFSIIKYDSGLVLNDLLK